jgi:hypothetical protein
MVGWREGIVTIARSDITGVVVHHGSVHANLRLKAGNIYEFLLTRGRQFEGNSEITRAWYEALTADKANVEFGQVPSYPVFSKRVGYLYLTGLVISLLVTFVAFAVSGAPTGLYIVVGLGFTIVLASIIWGMREYR